MKHNFLKKLTALLLGTIMVFSMIPASMFVANAAETSKSIQIVASKGTIATDKSLITWSSDGITVTSTKGSTAIRTSDTDHFRVYQDSKTTISVADGLISKMVITSTSSSYATAMSNSVETETKSNTVSGSVVTLEFDEPVDSVVIGANKQWRLNKIEVFLVEEVGACEHLDENPADCVCDNCSEELDHTWVDGEVLTPGTCTTDEVVAQVCDVCGATGENKINTATGHDFSEGNTCSVCGETLQGYVLVTDASQLKAGDSIIIVNNDAKVALGTTQNNNNRSQSAIEFVSGLILPSDTVQIITLEAGTVSGTFAFNTGSGYLYAASSSGNQLKTKTTKDANGSWSIAIAANGVATVVAQGTSTRNVLRYNSTSSLFSCYDADNDQKNVYIYKLVEPAPDPVFEGFGLVLNNGVTVRAKFTIDQAWIDANPDAKVCFSNGTEIAPKAGSEYYSVTLTPGQIGDNLTVSLGTLNNIDVSVSKYIERASALYATDTTLLALFEAIDAYHAAAARTQDLTLDDPDFTGVNNYKETGDVFTGFTEVILGEYANVGLSTSSVEDTYTFVATLGESSVSGKLVDNLDNGVLLIKNIRPANFNDEIAITVYNGNTVVATITFTFNSYLKEAYNTCEDALEKNIITATYNYGIAAEAYLSAHPEQ